MKQTSIRTPLKIFRVYNGTQQRMESKYARVYIEIDHNVRSTRSKRASGTLAEPRRLFIGVIGRNGAVIS